MGKYPMPTVQKFLKKKIIYDKPKKDPVWVYLEREMLENVENKPYNQKVGAWLKYLKDLRYFFYCEAKKKERRLLKEVGPCWYVELSIHQRETLSHLKQNIHQDVLEDVPCRVIQSLSELGVTLKIPRKILVKAMIDSVEDAGLFIWYLYTAIYDAPPSELQERYDMNAMILMSCLVFIDLDECIERLIKLTENKVSPPIKRKKKGKKNFTPDVRYGPYLQQMYVKLYCNHSSGEKKPAIKPPPLGCKMKLRSARSYTRLRNDQSFLKKRIQRNMVAKEEERVCTYKFWEPPSGLRNTDPSMAALASKQKMLKLKAKPKTKAPFKNVQYQYGGVAFTGGTPQYLISGVSIMPTGYIPINGGNVYILGEYVAIVTGFSKFPRKVVSACDAQCNCIERWESTVMDYLKESRCRCGHLYDFNLTGKLKETYFHPPNKHGPYWLDTAKIYQLDPMEDFIKDTVKTALMSRDPTPVPSEPMLASSGFTEILEALLAELSETPLLIPHLPEANYLNNLLEWLRKRMNGALTAADHKKNMLVSLRRWLDLKHMDFRARAYRIPFTLKQLENMNWSHRLLIQKLFNVLMEDFISRNRLKQLEQTRVWWPTTKFDAYACKPFLDIFFTYMPGRMKDTLIINPYSSMLTPKDVAKTCPL